MKLNNSMFLGTIRRAVEPDVELAYDFCESFFRQTADKAGFRFSHRDSVDLMVYMVKYQVTLVAEFNDRIIGVICGLIQESPFCRDQKVFKEVFWYVRPEHRGVIGKLLFTALEEELKVMGVDLIIMANWAGDEKLPEFYFYKDFKPMETSWIKRVE